MKAATRPFKSKYLSWCPLCKDRIREGDLIVKVEVPIKWHQVKSYKSRVGQYVQELVSEYVHESCFDKRNKRKRMSDFERIWLQTTDEHGETTWCQDKINDDDVEYVRADIHAALKQQLELEAVVSGLMQDENDALKRALQNLVADYGEIGGDAFYDDSYKEANALLTKETP